MDNPFLVAPIASVGPELRALAACARDENFPFMDRLIAHWEDRSNRFDQPGETYLGVWQSGELVAAGGLNRDPYSGGPQVGRVRHLYVHPAARRSGAGRTLMAAIIARSRDSFAVLRLRTTTERGAMFYESLGFARSDAADASHVMQL